MGKADVEITLKMEVRIRKGKTQFLKVALPLKQFISILLNYK